jgi:hypothetical protein
MIPRRSLISLDHDVGMSRPAGALALKRAVIIEVSTDFACAQARRQVAQAERCV